MKIQIKLRGRILFLLTLTLLLWLLPTTAALRATTIERLNLDQLAAGSDAVARVNFSSSQSRWEDGTIWTITTVKVVETIKGNLPGQISVRLPGGRVGHLIANVEGAPRFHPGDDAIVFLKNSALGAFTVAGWVEGTFRISRDPRTGKQAVTQDSSAFAIFDPTTRTFRTEGIHRMPIDEFRGQLAAAITRSEGKIR